MASHPQRKLATHKSQSSQYLPILPIMFSSIGDILALLALQDWETFRSTVLSNPSLFRNIASAVSACSQLNGMTILHTTVRFNPPLDIVAQIIKLCPVMLVAKDCLNRTPLHVAAGSKASASLLKLLADAFPAACDVQDEEGKTPLHFACDSSCILFEDDDDDDDNDDEKDTSKKPPNHESVAALLSYSIHAATLEDDEEMNPLEHAIMSNASFKTVRLLQNETIKAMELKAGSKSLITATKRSRAQEDDFTPSNCVFSSRPHKKKSRKISLD